MSTKKGKKKSSKKAAGKSAAAPSGIQRKCWLWLEFEVSDIADAPEALKAFKDIWPDPAPAAWKGFEVRAASNDDFLAQLDARFRSELKDFSPLPDKTTWEIEKLFAARMWRINSNGVHEWKDGVYYSSIMPRQFEAWWFKFGGAGREAKVIACARWEDL